MITSELIEKCSNSNEILFSELIHVLSKMSYIFESDKLTYSDIESIRQIVRSYILALLMKNNLKYIYSSKLIKEDKFYKKYILTKKDI